MKKIIIFLFSIITSVALAQDVKISAMPTATDLTGSTFIPIIQNGVNKKAVPGLFGNLIPTAVKTSNYTAAASDFVPCDITTGSFTVTLPTAPADNTIIGVKIVATLGVSTLTVARGGSDVFNVAGGSTSLVLSLPFQTVTLQYKSSSGIWYVVSTDKNMKSALDYYPNLDATLQNNTSLSYGRAASGIVVIGQWTYIMGGYNTKRYTNHDSITNHQVWRASNNNLASWSQLPNAPWQSRSRFGCVKIGTNKIIVYGQDLYDCGGENCNTFRDAWLGTVNLSTGAITWTLKNAAMPMSDRFWYASFSHKGCAYLAGGICDDWPQPPGPGHPVGWQCPNGELWKSCDDGATWSLVSSNNAWGYKYFNVGDTLMGRNVYGNGISYNNKIYMVGGGIVASNTYAKYTFDSTIFVSNNDGVTFTKIKPKIQKGVTSPALTVMNDKLFILFGDQFNPGGTAGIPSSLIQYLDTTNAAHQVYNVTIPKRSDAVAATVTSNGVTGIITGLGVDPTIADTTKQFLNDLYFLSPINDQKVVDGDVAKLRSLVVNDSLQATYVNPQTVNGILTLNKFVNVTRESLNRFNLTVGTTGAENSSPDIKYDFLGVNFLIGATPGAGGANRFENYTRTQNSTKYGRLLFANYDNNYPMDGLISYSTSGAKELYVGGDTGFGTTAFYSKMYFTLTSSFLAMKLGTTLANFYTPVSLVAGAAAAGKAPLYIPSGTNLSTTEAGAFENNGTHLYFTFANSGTRYQLDQQAGGDALTANPLSQFASTTSAQLAGVLSNETGTGLAVFSASPTFTGVPLAPTASLGTNTTQLATTAGVLAEISNASLGPFTTGAAGYTNLSGAAGSLLKGDNSWLAIGSNTFVLTSNGTTFSWAAPSGGGSGWNITGNTNLTGPTTITESSTNTVTFLTPGLGTTFTRGFGLAITNATAAALGAQQQSGIFSQVGAGWGTTGSASQEVAFHQRVLPVQGATAPTGNWILSSQINAGTVNSVMTVSDFGVANFINGAAVMVFDPGGRSMDFGNGTNIWKVNSNSAISISNVRNQTITQSAQSSTHTFMTWTQAAHTGGTSKGYNYIAGILTGQTATAEILDWDLDFSAKMTHATGTVANNRTIYIRPRVHDAVAASSMTKLSTFAIAGPPTVTGNASVGAGGAFAVDIESGDVNFSGNIQLGATSFINDANRNKLLEFTQVASSVNDIIIANAATGGTPALGVSGTDTNIPLQINTKGTGILNIYGNSMTIGGAGYASGSVGPISITGNNSSGSGQAGSSIVIKTGAGVTGNASSGSIFLDTDVKVGSGTVGGISFFKTTADFGGGEKVIYMGNATTNPTTNPTGGGLMFVKSADNKPYWRTPAGVETVMLGGAAGGSVFSSLSASVATNTIDNLNFANEWQWSTLAGISGLKISSASTAAASNAQRLFEVNLSGANATSTQTTTAGYFKNAHTGTTSTNIGLYAEASGGTTNRAISTLGDIEAKSTNTTISAYQAYTDENNYEVIQIGYSRYWNDHALEYDSKSGGTRVGGIFNIVSSGTSGQLYFTTFNATRWKIDNNGLFVPGTDNTYDIGEWTGGGKIPRTIGAYTIQAGSNAAPLTTTLNSIGSFGTGYIAKTANYTLTSSDHTVEVTSGTNTQTLPTAVGIKGRIYTITNSGSGVVTVATTSSQTFVNVTATPTTLTLNQFQTATVQSNNVNWLKVSGL